MTVRNVVKKTINAIVGIGTTQIVNAIISNNVEPVELHRKVTVAAASIAIGSAVAEATKTHTDAQIDEMFDAIDKIKAKFAKN